MKPIRMIQAHLPRIAAPALLVFLTACTLEIVQTSATEAPAVIPSNATPTATFQEPTPITTVGWPPAEPLPTVTVAQPPALPGGKWLMVETKQGLWLSRPDGSQARFWIPGPVSVPVPLSDAFSPDGRLFAYQTLVSSPNGCNNPVLNIISPTGAEPAIVIPLTSSQTACPGNLPTELDDVNRALTEYNPYAWSPDGGRLAFIGAQDGLSADLYEYYRVNGQIIRLSDGPDQAYRPQWSPDGQWIVHGAVSKFGTGAVYSVTGFYAARADGGEVRSLYPIDDRSGDEMGAGWLDAHTLVAFTAIWPCSSRSLRLVDLSTSTVDFIFEGCMDDVAVGNGVVLFSQTTSMGRTEANPQPGIFLVTAENRAPQRIDNSDVFSIEWSEEIGGFLARTDDSRMLEITASDKIRTLAVNGAHNPIPAVSPGGLHWAYGATSSGIYAGEYGQEPALIYQGWIAPNLVIFSEAGDALYFVTMSGELYRASTADWSLTLLATGLTPTMQVSIQEMAWWEG